MSVSKRWYRKIIHISAEDSPNVRLGLAQQRAGIQPTNEVLVPGILTWDEYVKRRRTWDKIRQRIGLDGKFWEGGETLMFPPAWLDRAERLNVFLSGRVRIARGMGVDSGEGTANTAIAVVDELGLIELLSERTPDTTRVIDFVTEVMYKYGIDPERVLFDRGGGGKQYADRMRLNGIDVRTVGFNDKPTIEPQRHKTQFGQRVEANERRYAYFNRRAEMYGELRYLLDPGTEQRDGLERAWQEVATERNRLPEQIRGFAIPHTYYRLREQLAPIPMKFELERLKLPPKHKRDPNSKEQTLTDIIGYSPDEADAVVLAVHAMQQTNIRTTAGAI